MDIIEQLGKMGARVELCSVKSPMLFKGEIITDFYVLKQGAAVAQYKSGRKLQTLTLGPGDFFGERALLLDAASDVTVRAVVDGTVMLAMGLDKLRLHMNAEPAFRDLLRAGINARRCALLARGVSWDVRLN